MKKVLLSILLSMMCVLSGCASSVNKDESNHKMEKVTVILDYVPNTNHTGMYVALEKGYYKELGLDVEIIEPTEGTTALVAVGKGDFGISYQEDVTVARSSSHPLPIRAIATIIQDNTSGFASYKPKGITSVKEFEGKTYAGWGGPGEEAVLQAVMEQQGMDYKTLKTIISDGSSFEVLKDKVDIMWFYEAWDNIKCELNDFEINYIPLRELDERLNFYTPVIITNEEMIASKPEVVKAFLAATAKGYEDAIKNPQEGAEILHHYVPEYSLEMLVASQRYLADKYKGDSKVWGMMKDAIWDNYTQFLMEYNVIESKVLARECYTNEFLEGRA